MARLEDLTRDCLVSGVLSDGPVTVIDVRWHGTDVVELTYKDQLGRLGSELLYRDRESVLDIVTSGLPWSFTGDGRLLKLASEAYRISLAHVFDPHLAVHTSLVEPLPHQIMAVYSEMLSRQPLRFLLADDPGAGKTIMAGLLIKELLIRGDLRRCMIVCPGALAEQWQDELYSKFQLPFDILTRDQLEAARTGNWFTEHGLVICRLDKLSRDENVQAKLAKTDWDLVVCDEAHKMSASFFSGEIKETKRYKLGKLLSSITRHFLLMTATPHNGKEEDFQLFLALLDSDRFEGKFRDGVHAVDASDLMRRFVKEQLLKFDGTPLFPERLAYTVNYELSDKEAKLYKEVTEYVRQEFNRADTLNNDGRKGTVGFALTILQRRLASSPEAIFQSLRRRKERLEKRLREERLLKRGEELAGGVFLSDEDLDDLEDAPDAEVEEVEEELVDQATAAQSLAELESEITTLKRLEELAGIVRRAGSDKKWEELSRILQDREFMFDAAGNRRKLVIFTEHRDTLNYLTQQIANLLGRSEIIVTIHGGMGREERRKAQELFTQDKDVLVLIATDAAGEGINLQRAHLMVNYDLPWNPNRLEQRFGRIHRIGQTEVCHLWNLVANETREGDVFHTLLMKLEEERKALGGAVFDVLGKVFQGTELRELLIKAIRYGDRADVRERLNEVVDKAMDRDRLRELLEERALARDSMNSSRVREIREDMERAEARRLQPHFISSFFIEAFRHLGGTIREREKKRYEITHVPAVIRNRDREIGVADPVLARYERITFEKELISVPGKPLAAFVCPGHPLLNSVVDVILERDRHLLKTGAVLVDEADNGTDLRVLCYLEHAVQDGRKLQSGARRIVSKQMQFVEITADGDPTPAGYAPYLDYREPTEEEGKVLTSIATGLQSKIDFEKRAQEFAISTLVPEHFNEVRRRRELLVRKTMSAVKERLTKEINYWDHRAATLKQQELAGKTPKINSALARERADELQARLQRRLEELNDELRLSPLPPVIIGAALVVPYGLLATLQGKEVSSEGAETERIERLAMEAVMSIEKELGYAPRDVSKDKCGYDIESKVGELGLLRFIEVKGRFADARTVTVTRNEVLTALNKPDQFILAIVRVAGEQVEVRYVREPFVREPDFAVTSINYDLKQVWEMGLEPLPNKTTVRVEGVVP